MIDPTPLSEPSAWARRVEHGTMIGMRFGRFLYRAIGRRGMDRILWLIAAYFFVKDWHARRAIRDWLETVWSFPAGRAALGERPGRFAPMRQMHNFAINMLDRMMMWLGEEDAFAIDHRGGEALLALAGTGRGGILLGAHLGSFDMLRLISRQYGLRVNVVMYTNHSARVNRFFESLGAESQVRVIRLDPSSVQSAFEIKACLDRGEFVGILADRVHAGSRERPIETLFLGRRAVFPLSPFLLGVVLGAPMFLSLCTATSDARYFAVTEPIFAGGHVPRAEREKVAREALEDWVRRFETHCLARPEQWFNFYEYFLDPPRSAQSEAQPDLQVRA